MKFFLRRSGKLTLVFLSLVVMFVMSGVNPAECREVSPEIMKSLINSHNEARQSETQNVFPRLSPEILDNPTTTPIDIRIPQRPSDSPTPTIPTTTAEPVGNTGLPQENSQNEPQKEVSIDSPDIPTDSPDISTKWPSPEQLEDIQNNIHNVLNIFLIRIKSIKKATI